MSQFGNRFFNNYSKCGCIDNSTEGRILQKMFRFDFLNICYEQISEIEKKVLTLCSARFVDVILRDIDNCGSGMYTIQPDTSIMTALNNLFFKFQLEYPSPNKSNTCKHGNSMCVSTVENAVLAILPKLYYRIIYDPRLKRHAFDTNGISDADILLYHVLPKWASDLKISLKNAHEYSKLFSKCGDNLENHGIVFELHVVSTGDENASNAQVDILYAKTV